MSSRSLVAGAAGILILGVGTSTRAAEPVFLAGASVATGVNLPDEARPCDLDGDGDLDLAAVIRSDNDVFVYLNAVGDASSWSAVLVDNNLVGAKSVVPADLDGDGDLDLAVGAQTGNEVVVYLNQGGGLTWSRASIGACSGAYQVTAADLDHDGDVDVAGICAGSGSVVWWANDGAAGGWGATTVATGFAAGSSLTHGDVDGDGDTDLVGAAFSDDDVSWFSNDDGVGGAWTETLIAGTYDGPLGVTVGDVDGDGDLDVLGAAGTAGSLDWFENTGAGASWTAQTIDAFASADSIFPTDLDEDGDLDVVVAGGTVAAWYENTGSAWTATSLAAALTTAVGATAADLDGDGDVDPIALSGTASGLIQWFENDTIHHSSAIETETAVSALASARGTVIGDIDGDGDLDVASSTSGGILQWSENTGAGASWTDHAIDTGFGDTVELALADVDGNGTLDLVAASLSLGDVAWWSNTAGTGLSWTQTLVDTTFLGANAVAVADVDGDGDMDIASAASSGDLVAWFDNTAGDGTAWTRVSVAASVDGAADVAIGDLDGDGGLDIVAAAITDDLVTAYLNDGGDGTVWISNSVGTGLDGANSVDLIDIDGDGDLDIVAGVGIDDDVRWFANNGSGTAWTAYTVDGSFNGARAVRGADVDLDGDADVIAVAADGAEVAWWESNGAAVPVWTQHTIETGLTGAHGLDLGDIDADGAVDVAASGRILGVVAWWSNERAQASSSTASAAPAGAVPPGTLASAVAIDPIHLGRFGDNAAEVAGVGIRIENGAGTALTTAQAAALFADVHVYVDSNGDDAYDAGDTLIASAGAPVLTAGAMTIPLPDGNSFIDFGLASPPTLLVVPETSATSGSALIPNVEIVHTAATTMEDDDFDTLLVLRTVTEASGTLAIDQPPTANAGPAAGSYTVAEGTALAMDGSLSADAETSIVEWAWDCDFDGSYETVSATAGGGSCTFPDDGSVTVGLRVTDTTGQTGVATGTVTVTNANPTITSSAPTTATEGVVYSYTPTATDPGTADTFTWAKGAGSPASMTVDPSTGLVSWTPTFAEEGANAVTLEVTDDDGGTGSQSWTVTVTAADVDNDGMADGWELQNGLDPAVDDSALDPDADGVSNLDEYLGGTDPNQFDGPQAPTLVSPIAGAEVGTATPVLTWTNATDPQGDTLTYDVEVYSDTTMATLLDSASGVAEGAGTTAYTVGVALTEGLDAAWRARAADPNVAGPWTNLETFFVNAVNEAPGAPAQIEPIQGQSVGVLRPTLRWAEATDPDRESLTYEVRLWDEGLTTVLASEAGVVPSGGEAQWDVTVDLTEDATYAWDARGIDAGGLEGPWADPETFFVNTENQAPGEVSFTAPADGAELESTAPTFSCTETTDPENEAITYRFELSRSASFDAVDLSADVAHTGAGEASWDLDAEGLSVDENETWHARVRAQDELDAASAWAEIEVFVRGPNDPPAVPVLIGPEDGADAGDALVAAHAEDPEGDDVVYEFVVARDEDLADVVETVQDVAPGAGPQGTADQTSWEVTASLSGTVFWSARAVDDRGDASEWAAPRTLRAGRDVVLEAPGPVEEGCRLSVAAGPRAGWIGLLLLAVLVRRRA